MLAEGHAGDEASSVGGDHAQQEGDDARLPLVTGQHQGDRGAQQRDVPDREQTRRGVPDEAFLTTPKAQHQTAQGREGQQADDQRVGRHALPRVLPGEVGTQHRGDGADHDRHQFGACPDPFEGVVHLDGAEAEGQRHEQDETPVPEGQGQDHCAEQRHPDGDRHGEVAPTAVVPRRGREVRRSDLLLAHGVGLLRSRAARPPWPSAARRSGRRTSWSRHRGTSRRELPRPRRSPCPSRDA